MFILMDCIFWNAQQPIEILSCLNLIEREKKYWSKKNAGGEKVNEERVN